MKFLITIAISFLVIFSSFSAFGSVVEEFHCKNKELTCPADYKKVEVEYTVDASPHFPICGGDMYEGVYCHCIPIGMKTISLKASEGYATQYDLYESFIVVPENTECDEGYKFLAGYSADPKHMLEPGSCHLEKSMINRTVEDQQEAGCSYLDIIRTETWGGGEAFEIYLDGTHFDMRDCPRWQTMANLKLLTGYSGENNLYNTAELKPETNRACVAKNEEDLGKYIALATGKPPIDQYVFNVSMHNKPDLFKCVRNNYTIAVKPAYWAFEHTCTVGAEEYDSNNTLQARYRTTSEGKIERQLFDEVTNTWGGKKPQENGDYPVFTTGYWEKNYKEGWCADAKNHCTIQKKIEIQADINLTKDIVIEAQSEGTWPFVIDLTSSTGNKISGGSITYNSTTNDDKMTHQILLKNNVLNNTQIIGEQLVPIFQKGLTTETAPAFEHLELDMASGGADSDKYKEFVNKCGSTPYCYKMFFSVATDTVPLVIQFTRDGVTQTACSIEGFQETSNKIFSSGYSCQYKFEIIDGSPKKIVVWFPPSAFKENKEDLLSLLDAVKPAISFNVAFTTKSASGIVGIIYAESNISIDYVGQFVDQEELDEIKQLTDNKNIKAKEVANIYVQSLLDAEIKDNEESFCKPFKCSSSDVVCIEQCGKTAGCQSATVYFCSFKASDHSIVKCKPLIGSLYPGMKFPEGFDKAKELAVLKEIPILITETQSYQNTCGALNASYNLSGFGGEKINLVGGTGTKCPEGSIPIGGQCIINSCPEGRKPDPDTNTCVCKLINADPVTCECAEGEQKKFIDFEWACAKPEEPPVTECTSTADCSDGKTCKNGVCISPVVVNKEFGDACSSSEECTKSDGLICYSGGCSCDLDNGYSINQLTGSGCVKAELTCEGENINGKCILNPSEAKCLKKGMLWKNDACVEKPFEATYGSGCSVVSGPISANGAAQMLIYLALLLVTRISYLVKRIS